MKRLLLACAPLLLLASMAWAAQSTPTPVVPPNETGENSAGQQQIMDMARLKVGMCQATATGSGAAAGTQTATCNGGAGSVTTVTLTFATVGALNTLTITDNKVNVGDICMAMVDPLATAATAGPEAMNCKVGANTLTVILTNNLAASPAGPVNVNFLVVTTGNPN
jgi:hypothetical protein